MKVLIGVTGSVATIKLSLLVDGLKLAIEGVEIKIVATKNAKAFIKPESINTEMLFDEDEWNNWHSIGDEILHIQLRDWADLFLIAPMDANTLAKAANGLCDNLLTCVLRAWPIEKKPIVIAPAMNTQMYAHPVTEQHLTQLRAWNYIIAGPIEKKLACGDWGLGGMIEVKDLIESIKILNF